MFFYQTTIEKKMKNDSNPNNRQQDILYLPRPSLDKRYIRYWDKDTPRYKIDRKIYEVIKNGRL